MSRLFGTDGIRGTTEVSSDEDRALRLTPELVLRIGHAVGHLVRTRFAQTGRGRVVIGRDTRISGMMLESALTTGLLAQGVDVLQMGVVPTPAIALATRRVNAQLGIVISASHNPVGDNGIKFFGPQGYKLQDELEGEIQALVADVSLAFAANSTRSLGRIEHREDLQQMYTDYLVQTWRGESDLADVTVMLECTHGATSHIAPEVFRRLGAQVEVVSGAPDGLNINESYEYIQPGQFGELVVERGADLGVAFDGDGDRVILLDEQGRPVDGDAILAILARSLLAEDRLPGRTVVATNMSNYGLHDSLRQVGIGVVETGVGDKYVLREMLAHGYTLGGERSGHILILDGEQVTGDGIYTALATTAAMVDRSKPLSELASVMERYPQFIESASVSPKKPPLDQIGAVQAALRGLQERLGDHAEINLRYSGTEDKVRLSVRSLRNGNEASITEEAHKALQEIAQAINARAH